MNKMVINHLEKLFVTNDAATIIRELEVVHPAAKMLVMASQSQEAEVGDATNLVVTLAGELLSKAEHLLKMGLHTSDVVEGYDKAGKRALEMLSGRASREHEANHTLIHVHRSGCIFSIQLHQRGRSI